MPRLALDATYSAEPSLPASACIRVASIETLLTLDTPHRFLIWYRLSRLLGGGSSFFAGIRSQAPSKIPR